MRQAENKQFLDRLRADPRQFEKKSLLRDVILSDDPQLIFEVIQIARELIAENRLSAHAVLDLFSVDVPLPGISNRFMRFMGYGYTAETLIETVVKIIAQKQNSSTLEELNELQRILACVFFHSAERTLNLDRYLRDFLLYASPELVNLFFVHLNSAIEKGILARETCLGVFNTMIQSDFIINKAVKNNRISVLKGLKTLGYDLSSERSSIHLLAGSATIATASFLLEEGADINAKNRNNHTALWYIIQNIHDMSEVIDSDFSFIHEYDYLYNDSDLLNFYNKDSLVFQKRFLLDNTIKALFLLERGAEMTIEEAKKLDAALSLFYRNIHKNKQKYREIPLGKLQYLRGLVKEKLGKSQQASYHFIDAATLGHKSAALKLAEYYLSIKKEEDALIWYQQAINNSAAPKPTLFHLIGLEKMIQLAHGISLRKTETTVDLQREYAVIMRELGKVDYSQQTIAIDGLLQLAHLAVEESASTEHHQFALKLTCAAYDKAINEDKSRLIQVQHDIQHVMNSVLSQLREEEAKHYAGIRFMPTPSERGIAHYYRLCLELAQINLDLNLLNEDSQQRTHYWVEMAAILGHKDQAIFSENLRESIDKELRNIAGIMPDLIEERSRDRGQVMRLGF